MGFLDAIKTIQNILESHPSLLMIDVTHPDIVGVSWLDDTGVSKWQEFETPADAWKHIESILSVAA